MRVRVRTASRVRFSGEWRWSVSSNIMTGSSLRRLSIIADSENAAHARQRDGCEPPAAPRPPTATGPPAAR